jgi:hypothetical protein
LSNRRSPLVSSREGNAEAGKPGFWPPAFDSGQIFSAVLWEQMAFYWPPDCFLKDSLKLNSKAQNTFLGHYNVVLQGQCHEIFDPHFCINQFHLGP